MKTAILAGMGKWTRFLCAAFMAGALVVSQANAGDVAVGKSAPDFTARTVTGKLFTLSQQKGQTVLLTFWSTWCTLNREEMAFLRQLEDHYPELVFVIVDAGSVQPDIKSLAQVWKALNEWALDAVVLPDKGLQLTELYGVQALPTSIIVGPDGRISHAEPNFLWPDQERVTRFLEQKNAASTFLGNPEKDGN